MVFESLGTPEELGLIVREQPVYSKSGRPSAIIVTLRMLEFNTSEHDELVRPWQASVELAVLRAPDGRILAVNEAFARKFGVPRASSSGAQLLSMRSWVRSKAMMRSTSSNQSLSNWRARCTSPS